LKCSGDTALAKPDIAGIKAIRDASKLARVKEKKRFMIYLLLMLMVYAASIHARYNLSNGAFA